MFFKPKVCKHKYSRVVAYDRGYHTTYTDESSLYHQVEFLECMDCGENRHVSINANFSKREQGVGKRHSSIVAAKHDWIERKRLNLTSKSDIYDDNYACTEPMTVKVRCWEYRPVTEMEKILIMLQENDEFQELCKNQMVADAFGELETVIKMHEGIDKSA